MVGMTRERAPVSFEDPERVADEIIARVGKSITLALPLGLGKANHVANALFARAAADPSIRLRIFTALTLETPRGKSDLERRFVTPVAELLFAGYPELAYALALNAGTLPANITVDEFFFEAGTRLGIAASQQHQRELHPCAALRARSRRQRGRAAPRQAGARTRDALESQLQSGPHARPLGLPRARRMRFRLRGTGQFGAALHARRRRYRGGRIRPPLGEPGDRLSLVRAAARAHRSFRIRDRAQRGAHHRRRRHAAARHRLARRRGDAGAHPAAPAQRRISRAGDAA